MNDLEKFLQQAAERLAQKLNEGQKPRPAKPPVAQRQAPPSVRSAERQPPRREPDIIEAELVEADRYSSRRELGPNPLSNIDTLPELAQEISQTDERMSGHLHDVFDHNVAQLKQSKRAANSTSPQGDINKAIDLQRRNLDVSPLVKSLRQPETLRAAFLASEIFKRKFKF